MANEAKPQSDGRTVAGRKSGLKSQPCPAIKKNSPLSGTDDLANGMAAAIRNGSTLPKMPANLGIEEAYALQKTVVAAVSGGSVAGLKAGLTAAAAQAQFGVSHPLIGCLYEQGRMAPGVSFASAPGVMLECEIGVVIDERGVPQSAGPVIEVPRMAFADSEDVNGVNLLACNIAADRYIVGTQLPMLASYAEIEARLIRDGQTVSTAPATEALGGPGPAVEWILREARLRGFPIAEGMLLITGAIGGIHPAEPGSYRADYGVLGSIEFTVT